MISHEVIIVTGLAVTTLTSIGALVMGVVNGQRAKKIGDDVLVIEKATNSMKDALVAATAKASLAEGKAIGLEQGREESAEQPLKIDVVVKNGLKE